MPILYMYFYSYYHQSIVTYKNKKINSSLSNRTNKACFASDLFPISQQLKATKFCNATCAKAIPKFPLKHFPSHKTKSPWSSCGDVPAVCVTARGWAAQGTAVPSPWVSLFSPSLSSVPNQVRNMTSATLFEWTYRLKDEREFGKPVP